MGSSLSKVSCADISIHPKKTHKSFRRHAVRIDKTKIGVPTDFRASIIHIKSKPRINTLLFFPYTLAYISCR